MTSVSTLPLGLRWVRRDSAPGVDAVRYSVTWSGTGLVSKPVGRHTVKAAVAGQIVQGTGTPSPNVSIENFAVGDRATGTGVKRVTHKTNRFKVDSPFFASYRIRVDRRVQSKSFFWVDDRGNPIPIPMNSAPMAAGLYTGSISGDTPSVPGRYTLVYTIDKRPTLYRVVDMVR